MGKKKEEEKVNLDVSIFDKEDEYGNTLIKPKAYPSIYAFYNPNVPDYLKVGFTSKEVKRRLEQWRAKEGYQNIEEKGSWTAKTKNDEVYFRDESVHRYLQEQNHNHHRLQRNEWQNDFYFSDEYFQFQKQNAQDLIDDVTKAVNEIADSVNNPDSPYAYYNVKDNMREEDNIIRNKTYEPRDNQKEVIDSFNKAMADGRKNLLMYAVMRFGKTFTALECAEELIKKNKKPIFIVIISGYANVWDEWYKGLKEHTDFENIEAYESSYDDGFTVEHIKELKNEGKSTAVFLTLQELNNAPGNNPNDRRKPAFEIPIDLLIVDETHFAARGDRYGRVLEDYDSDVGDERELEEEAKTLRSENTIVLHLSGTPYRILMGNEFTKDDIIASVNYVNILEEQEKYDKEINEGEKDSDGIVKYEWDNPYYGFPEMIRFGFDLDDASINELKSMNQDSVLNELFKTKSTTKDDNGDYKKFLHQKLVGNLFKAIDGSSYKDKNIFGFLNYQKIKDAEMCNHIVIVLPYRASCDALASLLETRKNSKNKDFKNLSEYEVINIAGLDNQDYDNPYLSRIIKNRITSFARVGKKTISLTVKKMLTGVTVPEWDTMIFLRGTSSAQEYDQATYRIQNQYITELTDKNGNKICINNKPQTLLVDFDLNRLFSLQERNSKIMNYVQGADGDESLKETVAEAVKRSPIIYIKDNKLVRVESADVIDEVKKYRKGHSIMDEAGLLPVDLDILDYGDGALKEYIEKEFKLGSKKGLNIQNHSDHRAHLDEEEIVDDENEDEPLEDEENEQNQDANNDDDEKTIEGKIRSCYAKILFLAFLVEEEEINTLKELYNKINDNENDKKICERIGMDFDIFELFYKYFYDDPNKGSLLELNDSIAYLNDLAHNDEPDKISTILNKFSKLGSAVVLTPQNVCEDMVKMIPDDGFKDLGKDNKILDIASTAGEFCPALVKRMRDELHIDWNIIKDSIVTIPKNGLCYELAVRVYRELGLNEENVVSDKTAFDLINKDLDSKKTKKNSSKKKEN